MRRQEQGGADRMSSGVRVYVDAADEGATGAGPSCGGAAAAVPARRKGKGRKRAAPALEDVSNGRTSRRRTRGPSKVHPSGGEKVKVRRHSRARFSPTARRAPLCINRSPHRSLRTAARVPPAQEGKMGQNMGEGMMTRSARRRAAEAKEQGKEQAKDAPPDSCSPEPAATASDELLALRAPPPYDRCALLAPYDLQDLQSAPACAEYAADITEYHFQHEKLYPPNPQYIGAINHDISQHMRSILVDWLVEVAEEYRLQPETLFLCVSIPSAAGAAATCCYSAAAVRHPPSHLPSTRRPRTQPDPASVSCRLPVRCRSISLTAA